MSPLSPVNRTPEQNRSQSSLPPPPLRDRHLPYNLSFLHLSKHNSVQCHLFSDTSSWIPQHSKLLPTLLLAPKYSIVMPSHLQEKVHDLLHGKPENSVASPSYDTKASANASSTAKPSPPVIQDPPNSLKAAEKAGDRNFKKWMDDDRKLRASQGR